VALLALANQALLVGVPVLLFEPSHAASAEAVTTTTTTDIVPGQEVEEYAAIASRDYSQIGVSAYRRLVEAGAQWVNSHPDLLSHLQPFI
jgi:hypothetical protein